MESLKNQGYIFLDLSKPRWLWSLDKIVELQLAGNVVDFLVKEMRKLGPSLQMGLKVAACLGTNASYEIIDILSRSWVGIAKYLGASLT